jgi:hypothetical protein
MTIFMSEMVSSLDAFSNEPRSAWLFSTPIISELARIVRDENKYLVKK